MPHGPDDIVDMAGNRRIGNYETDWRERKFGLGTAVNLKEIDVSKNMHCPKCVFDEGDHADFCPIKIACAGIP